MIAHRTCTEWQWSPKVGHFTPSTFTESLTLESESSSPVLLLCILCFRHNRMTSNKIFQMEYIMSVDLSNRNHFPSDFSPSAILRALTMDDSPRLLDRYAVLSSSQNNVNIQWPLLTQVEIRPACSKHSSNHRLALQFRRYGMR